MFANVPEAKENLLARIYLMGEEIDSTFNGKN